MSSKKDKEPQEKFLGTGASGDPEHPEAGSPAGSPVLVEDFAPVTEVETKKKEADK